MDRVTRLAPYLRIRAAQLPANDPERLRILRLLGEPTPAPPARHWTEDYLVLVAIAATCALVMAAGLSVVAKL